MNIRRSRLRIFCRLALAVTSVSSLLWQPVTGNPLAVPCEGKEKPDVNLVVLVALNWCAAGGQAPAVTSTRSHSRRCIVGCAVHVRVRNRNRWRSSLLSIEECISTLEQMRKNVMFFFNAAVDSYTVTLLPPAL